MHCALAHPPNGCTGVTSRTAAAPPTWARCGRQAGEAICRCASGSGNSTSPCASTAGVHESPQVRRNSTAGSYAGDHGLPRATHAQMLWLAQSNTRLYCWPDSTACHPPAGCWSASACSTRSAAAAASKAVSGPCRCATHHRSSRTAARGSGSGMPAAQKKVAPVIAPELRRCNAGEWW